MGLREVFQNAAVTIMDAAGNVPEIGTLKHLAYDANGQPTEVGTVLVQNLRMIRESYIVEKVDDVNTLRNARQYRVIGLDLGGVVPREDDELQFGSEVWIIRFVDPDPVSASYLLHVRR